MIARETVQRHALARLATSIVPALAYVAATLDHAGQLARRWSTFVGRAMPAEPHEASPIKPHNL
jgi:hypothetical protein